MSGRSSLLKGMVSHWNTLPREVLDGTSLEMFKASLSGALTSLI